MSWAAICRYGGVGDNLIASSVLPALKKKYGHVEVISQEPQSAVFENNPFIDKLSVHKPGQIPGDSAEAWKKWHDIRAKEYDLFVNLSHSVETLRAFLPAQTQSSWPAAWRRKFAAQSYVETAADICGVDPKDCSPGFFPTEAETHKALETLEKVGRPCIGWVLSGTRIDKIYPASTIAVARLINELGAQVILFGAPGINHDMAKKIQDHVQRQNGSLDGLHAACDEKLEDQKWPIRRIITQLQHCDLAIGPDTGPLWGVASLSLPKIMLLSHAGINNITKGWLNTATLHADPAKVPCWPCHQLHDSLDTCTPDETRQAAACISSISPSMIVEAAHAALHQRSAADERAEEHGGEGAESGTGSVQSLSRGHRRHSANGEAARTP